MSNYANASRGRMPAVIRRSAWVLTASYLLAATSVATAEEWSRFRGPNGSGVALDVEFPAAWTDDDYAWRIPLPGKGHSSPIGWGDRIFLTTGNADTGEISLLAIDAESGDMLWTRRFGSAPHNLHGFNSYASSSCAADAERVYVAWASPMSMQIAALDHGGKPIWQRDLGPVDYRHGYGISPIVVDDMVIVANDHAGESSIVAIDAASGDPRWRLPRTPGNDSYATPAVWSDDAGREQIIVSNSADGMAGLSPASGSVLWQLRDLHVARCVASPLVAGGLVFGTSGEGGDGKSFAAVRPGVDGAEATVAYELKKSLPQVPTPVAKDDLLFVWSDRGVVTCCDVATGEVHWTERVGGNYFSSPIIAGEKIYGVAADGEVVVIAASKEYKLLGRTPLGASTSATPGVHRGRMYLRTESSLACLRAVK